MFKYFLTRAGIYLIILVFVVPIIIFMMLGNAARKSPKNVSPTPVVMSQTPVGVPLPTREDIVRTFCNLVDEGRISDAVGMMDIPDENTRQSWGVSLSSFSSFKLISIKKSTLSEDGNSFEVDINVRLKKDLSDLVIPNYGWVNGINKKWINLVEKEKGLYKIKEIATGP